MSDNSFAAGFDDAGADKESLSTKGGVAHPFFVPLQVGDFAQRISASLLILWQERGGVSGDRFDLATIQQFPPAQTQGALRAGI